MTVIQLEYLTHVIADSYRQQMVALESLEAQIIEIRETILNLDEDDIYIYLQQARDLRRSYKALKKGIMDDMELLVAINREVGRSTSIATFPMNRRLASKIAKHFPTYE